MDASTSPRPSVTAQPRVATLPCARKWPAALDGRGYRPLRGTWLPHLIRREEDAAPYLVPLLACPRCAAVLTLVLDTESARLLQASGKPGGPVVKPTHSVDAEGAVSPEPRCGCGWYGAVLLSEWNRWQTLFCAMVLEGSNPQMHAVYTHAVDAREAAHAICLRPGRRLVSISPVIRNDQERLVLL